MKNTLKSLMHIYGLTVCLAFIHFSFQFIKSNDFITYLFLGEIVPALQSTIWPYYLISNRDTNVSKSSGRFFKIRTVSNEDLNKYKISFNSLTKEIYNKITITDNNGNYLKSNLSSIQIPSILKENFTESAIRDYIKRFDISKIQGYMNNIADTSYWHWAAVSEAISFYEEEYMLRVVIYNSSPYSISSITIHISGFERSYRLITSYKSGLFYLPPNQIGVFEININYGIYSYIRNNECSARITRIYW